MAVTTVYATTGRGLLTFRLHPDRPDLVHVELPDGDMHLYERAALLAALTSTTTALPGPTEGARR